MTDTDGNYGKNPIPGQMTIVCVILYDTVLFCITRAVCRPMVSQKMLASLVIAWYFEA